MKNKTPHDYYLELKAIAKKKGMSVSAYVMSKGICRTTPYRWIENRTGFVYMSVLRKLGIDP